MDDHQIIELYFARDERAIRETDAKYGSLCHSVARNILHNDQDAEECVNDTYVGAWNAIPPTRPLCFSAFVCRITRNLSLKRLEAMTRQKRAHTAVVSLDELAEILPDERIAADADDGAIGRAISTFLRGEKEDVRRVFIRKYFFFDSVRSIAQRYGFTESKVKSMLHHTRSRLKKYLIKEGISL